MDQENQQVSSKSVEQENQLGLSKSLDQDIYGDQESHRIKRSILIKSVSGSQSRDHNGSSNSVNQAINISKGIL